MAAHSSVLAWRIPGMGEPGGLLSMAVYGVAQSRTRLKRLSSSSSVLFGLPGSSAGKESTCNAGYSGSLPGLGRSPAEGTGYPLPYSWASLVVQMIKNLPAVRETWVRSMGWEDPLEEGMVTHSSILAWRIPMDRGAWQAAVHGVTKSQTWLSD